MSLADTGSVSAMQIEQEAWQQAEERKRQLEQAAKHAAEEAVRIQRRAEARQGTIASPNTLLRNMLLLEGPICSGSESYHHGCAYVN
jgi:septum formation inhibitor MinC